MIKISKSRLSRLIFISILTSCISSLFVSLYVINSVTLSFDSWSYWETATSIAQGYGFRSLLGSPIIAWPPLFSFYLSLWTGADKYLSFGEIKAALIFLAFTSALIWSMVINSEFKENLSPVLIGNFFIAFVTPTFYTSLLSETLWMPLVGSLFYITSLNKFYADGKKQLLLTFLFSLILFLCLMTRNISVVLGPLFLLFTYFRSNIRVALRLLIPLAFSYLGWIIWRYLSGQSSSHSPTPDFSLFVPSVINLFTIILDVLSPRFFYVNLVVFFLILVVYTVSSLKVFQKKICFQFIKSKSSTYFLFSFSYVFLSFMLSFIIGIPTNETRFYYLFILTLFISMLHLAFFDGHRVNLLKILKKFLILILMVTYVYRTVFFVSFASQHNQKLSNDFYLSKQYIEALVLDINQKNIRGIPLNVAVEEHGISINRYFIWKDDFDTNLN